MLTRRGTVWSSAGMANVLGDEKNQQVLALGRLGWTLRRIEQATGVRCATSSAYLKSAGMPVRPPRAWGHPPPKAAKEASTDSPEEGTAGPGSCAANPDKETSTDPVAPSATPPTWPPRPSRAPSASACEPYREHIERDLVRGRNAMPIFQDLVTDHGFAAGCASVKRFVGKLRGARVPEARAIIVTAPGEEAQVDYGEGPMVRYPETGKYRRTRLFVLTLGYSRKSIRLLTFHSSSRTWAELHETAFRRLGGATRVVVQDNLRKGVLTPDI